MVWGISTVLHAFAAFIWFGILLISGAMLPTVLATVSSTERLKGWHRFLGIAFPWILGAIVIVLLSGYHMMFAYFGGFKAPLYIGLMHGGGLLTMAAFLHIYFTPYKRFCRAVANESWELAERQFQQMYKLMLVNALLVAAISAIGLAGPRWFY